MLIYLSDLMDRERDNVKKIRAAKMVFYAECRMVGDDVKQGAKTPEQARAELKNKKAAILPGILEKEKQLEKIRVYISRNYGRVGK